MKMQFTDTYKYNIRVLMQKCGYAETSNAKRETSYVRVFGRGGYPRFHCYIEPADSGFTVNLHLDQKKPTYGEGTAHSGEYDGDVVEEEGKRIKLWFASLRSS